MYHGSLNFCYHRLQNLPSSINWNKDIIDFGHVYCIAKMELALSLNLQINQASVDRGCTFNVQFA